MQFAAIALLGALTVSAVSCAAAVPESSPHMRPHRSMSINQGGCVQGFVDVSLTLPVDGYAINSVVLASHPKGEFDEAALKYTEGRRFPREWADENSRILLRVVFKLDVYQHQRCLDNENTA
jgi:hypothetical protein